MQILQTEFLFRLRPDVEAQPSDFVQRRIVGIKYTPSEKVRGVACMMNDSYRLLLLAKICYGSAHAYKSSAKYKSSANGNEEYLWTLSKMRLS